MYGTTRTADATANIADLAAAAIDLTDALYEALSIDIVADALADARAVGDARVLALDAARAALATLARSVHERRS